MTFRERLSQIDRLLTKEEKISAFKLLLGVMIMGLFDVVGVASILPFMSIASDPNFVQSNDLLLKIYNFLGFDDHIKFVMFSGLCVVALITISTLVKLITIYALYKFTFGREHTISLRLLTGYLNQPYSWFLNQHSSDLTKSVLADVREVVSRSILTIIMICSNSFLAILIVMLLIIVDPMIATGKSFVKSLNTILKKGNPKCVHIVGVIASKFGVDYILNNINFENCSLWIGAEDPQLNSKSYIVPGLGDAGDLSYGTKI